MENARQKIVNRPQAVQPAVLPPIAQPVRIQTSRKVSSPHDPAEKEAEAAAGRIMRMATPESSFGHPHSGGGDPGEAGKTHRYTQRKNEGPSGASPTISSGIPGGGSGGSPLPTSVRRFMEPRFKADFGSVRIHTGEQSATLNKQLNAQAFTTGNQIFFGKDRFKPETHDGRELIAHELTHTIQQGAVIQRSEDITITTDSAGQVQRFGLSDALDYIADKANYIPGFRMFTIVLGVNPINMSRVERNAANIMRAIVEFLPGGGVITQALDNYGVFDKVGTWVEQQIRSLGMAGSAFKDALTRFLGTLGLSDLLNPGGVWERAKRIFTEPIDRIISFAKGLVVGIIKFIKDAILLPLCRLAEGTRGYDLLRAVLGQDPITGEPVPRNAETLIGGFMKLIGKEEIWENLKKSNAVPRAWAWFQGAVASLLGFVRQVPSLFIKALQSLELLDIVLVPRAFLKVASVFGGFIVNFLTWAGNAVWTLLEIIFDVVAPGVLQYLKKAAGAFKTILNNPIGFVGNLVKAAKLGFEQFATNIGKHLKASLIGWLTGSLGGLDIYIPQSFELKEIIKFVLSVLGLTWQNIRQKLVRVVGETAVKAMETGFDIVMTLVTQGPAAAWEKIKEQLTNLKEIILEEIMSFVVVKVVQSAVLKLVSMLNPAGAILQAIIAIYNTIMFFVERLHQIIQVVTAFIDSIAAIAAGVITAAANRVEQTLAGLLTLAISFLARIAGLGRVSDAVTNIINKIRAPIDRALDKVVEWIVNVGRNFLSKILGGDPNAPPEERVDAALGAGVTAVNRLSGNAIGEVALRPLLAGIKAKYKLQSLEAIAEGGRWVLEGRASPAKRRPTSKLIAEGTGTGSFRTMIVYHASDARRGGKKMVADPLGPDHPAGTSPSSGGAPPIWEDVNTRRNRRRLYVLGHLLNMKLGGSGDTPKNLTPITFSANATHEAQVERALKTRANNDKKWSYYEVTVNYPSSRQSTPEGVEAQEGWLATSLTAKWQPMEPKPSNPKELERQGNMESVTISNVEGGKFPQT